MTATKPNLTVPKAFVFVLMPFDHSFDDTYELGIKAACSDAGAYCERVDEQIYTESILERVYNQINKADIVVAVMTGRNPNVFYEVGYAHALGKTVILLTEEARDIPFDLQHYPHIVYAGKIAGLKKTLAERVAWFAKQAKQGRVPSQDISAMASFYAWENPLTDGTIVHVPPGWMNRVYFVMRLAVENRTATNLGTEMEVALVVETVRDGRLQLFRIQDSLGGDTRVDDAISGVRRLHYKPNCVKVELPTTDVTVFKVGDSAMPGPFSWTSTLLVFRHLGSDHFPEAGLTAQLRLSHASGVHTLNFTILANHQDSAQIDPDPIVQ